MCRKGAYALERKILCFSFYLFSILCCRSRKIRVLFETKSMAAANDWLEKLNSSGMFDAIRKNSNKLKCTAQAKSLMDVYDGKLYVWDSYNAALLVTNLASLKPLSSYQVSLSHVDSLVAAGPLEPKILYIL